MANQKESLHDRLAALEKRTAELEKEFYTLFERSNKVDEWVQRNVDKVHFNIVIFPVPNGCFVWGYYRCMVPPEMKFWYDYKI